MDRKGQAQRLRENELLGELLGAWRQEVIDDMLAEPDKARRETLWLEQSFLERLSERLTVELDNIITSGRESDDDTGREPES